MPLLSEGPLQARDLRLLADDEHAEAAFLRLWDLMRDRLERAAVRLGLPPTEAEDVVQSVSVRLWQRRHRLAESSIGPFWALAFKSVKNMAIDWGRRQSKASEQAIEDELLPSEDVPYVDVLVERSLERESVYAAADRLWLGALSGADETRILAVQLCLIEGLPVAEVGAMLRIPVEELVGSLRDPLIGCHALYRALRWENDELARYVLDPEAPPTSQRVEELLREAQHGGAASVGPWISLEVAIVILRVRFGMTEDEISRALSGRVDALTAAAVIRRAVDAYPFVRIAENAVGAWRPSETEPSEAGVWRRLVFEYHLRHQLPHKQILERVAPAASTLHFELKPTTLNSWIGNGRLWAQIASFVANEHAP